MRPTIANFVAALLLILAHLTASAPPAQATEDSASTITEKTPLLRYDTPSGYPVPRFVSLKAQKTYCRSGPSFAHPVHITFLRKGLPVIVIAETNDHWRKIRDQDGDVCWTHRSKLSGIKMGLVTEEGLILQALPQENATIRARLGRGVIVKIEKTRGQWVRISIKNRGGWALQSGLWGVTDIAPMN